jgi:hypothetical protein
VPPLRKPEHIKRAQSAPCSCSKTATDRTRAPQRACTIGRQKARCFEAARRIENRPQNAQATGPNRRPPLLIRMHPLRCIRHCVRPITSSSGAPCTPALSISSPSRRSLRSRPDTRFRPNVARVGVGSRVTRRRRSTARSIPADASHPSQHEGSLDPVRNAFFRTRFGGRQRPG